MHFDIRGAPVLVLDLFMEIMKYFEYVLPGFDTGVTHYS